MRHTFEPESSQCDAGGSLDRYGRIPEEILCRIAVRIVEGLLYMWSLKILHRGKVYLICGALKFFALLNPSSHEVLPQICFIAFAFLLFCCLKYRLILVDVCLSHMLNAHLLKPGLCLELAIFLVSLAKYW